MLVLYKSCEQTHRGLFFCKFRDTVITPVRFLIIINHDRERGSGLHLSWCLQGPRRSAVGDDALLARSIRMDPAPPAWHTARTRSRTWGRKDRRSIPATASRSADTEPGQVSAERLRPGGLSCPPQDSAQGRRSGRQGPNRPRLQAERAAWTQAHLSAFIPSSCVTGGPRSNPAVSEF